MVDIKSFSPKAVQVHNVAVNEELGRISIDGMVNGKLAAVVFQAEEIPRRVKTVEQYSRFLERKLAEAAEESPAADIQDPENAGG